jgi:adenylate cyclase
VVAVLSSLDLEEGGRPMTADRGRETLAAILAADAHGYSRLMDADARATVAALDAAREVFRRHIDAQHGRLVDMAGDSVLAVFDTAVGAAAAALAVQADLGTAQQPLPDAQRLRFRIGLHLGDVIQKADGSAYGSGINVAARLQTLAEPGGITASDAIRGAVKGRVAAGFADLGEQRVKNIAEPVRTFKLLPGDPSAIAHAVVAMDAPVPAFGGRPAIAVLPFDNMSADPDQQYFADGLAEDILTRLAAWRWLPVIARNSSFTYRGRSVDVKEVGRALGARYVLEGSVRRAGERLRVTGQLIDATNGHHLWAQKYDRKVDDLFAIQDEITDSLCAALQSAIGVAEFERARVKQPASLDAWECVARALPLIHHATRDGLVEAETWCRRAHELDPGSARPLASLAMIGNFRGIYGWAVPKESFATAAAFARQALAVDAADSVAHGALAMALAVAGRADEAMPLALRATELNPSNARARHCLCTVCLLRGDVAQGLAAAERAIRLSGSDPALYMYLSLLGVGYYMDKNYERSAELQRLATECGPHYPMAWRGLASALGQLGRIDEAKAALARFLELVPSYTSEAAARAMMNFRDDALFQHYLEGLRKAGWQG